MRALGRSLVECKSSQGVCVHKYKTECFCLPLQKIHDWVASNASWYDHMVSFLQDDDDVKRYSWHIILIPSEHVLVC